jgi:myo-inositol-1(or 4)-monophosphatase
VSEIALIESILNEAGPIAIERYGDRASLKISSKLNAVDVLTDADEFIQAFITKRILAAYPDDEVVGEELGSDTFTDEIRSKRAWIIDPIDGTQNFVRGLFPTFGISIAFVEHGQVQAGGIQIPLLNKQFLGTRGHGATCNGDAISVSTVPTLDRARVEVDYGNPIDRADVIAAFTPLVQAAGEPRCHCATVITLCSVACGEMDVYTHINVKPWDYAAGILIVEEAGGTISQANGEAIDVWGKNLGLVGTNGVLHDEVLRVTVLPAAS